MKHTRPAFVDLPHEERMTLRATICDLGANVCGYSGNGVTLAMPNDPIARDSIETMLRDAGYPKQSAHLFPLGSDNPPDTMRHQGCYNGPPGFWLYAHFAPED